MDSQQSNGHSKQNGTTNKDRRRSLAEVSGWTTLKQYGEETTFHGFRQIVQDHQNRSRRFLWIFIVVAAMFGFGYAITIKLIQYFKYDSQVDVSINYNQTLPFPKVTICNQNQYRLTEVMEHGMYDIIVQSIRNNTLQGQLKSFNKCEDYFEIMTGICSLNPSSLSPQFYERYDRTSMEACEQLCSGPRDWLCSGFFFDFDQSTCHLVSYRGLDASPVSEKECFHVPQLFVRNRCSKTQSVFCNFVKGINEGFDECPLTSNLQSTDQWNVNSGIDSTMAGIAEGQYLYILETGIRGGYEGEIFFPYINTTAKCLRFAYTFFGSGPATLEVIVTNQDLLVEEIAKIQSTGQKEPWMFHQIQLPDGLNKVSFKGRRGLTGKSGLGLDDIELTSCSDFDELSHCLNDIAGRTYNGNNDISQHKRTCLSWDSYASDFVREHGKFIDGSIEGAENFCRNPIGDSPRPWCYVEEKETRACVLPYCPCRDGYFRCNSGRCIPDLYTCNGKYECEEGEDEVTPCEHKMSTSCNFDDPYSCGYSVNPMPIDGVQEVAWRQATIDLDDTTASVMKFEALYSSDGARSLLISPVEEYTNNTLVTANVIDQTERMDITTSFYVLLADEHAMITNQFIKVNSSASGDASMQVLRICMPPGRHRLVFLASRGLNTSPFIAVDSVDVTEEACELDMTEADFLIGGAIHVWNTSVSFVPINAFLSWAQTPSHVDFDQPLPTESIFGCGARLYDLGGTIYSPGFPVSYPRNSDCHWDIMPGIPSVITVSFEFISIEQSDNCSYDFVEIFNEEIGETVFKFCSGRLPRPVMVSTSHLSIRFMSDDSVVSEGFLLKYFVQPITPPELVMSAVYLGPETARSRKAIIVIQIPEHIKGRHCFHLEYHIEEVLVVYKASSMVNNNEQPSLVMSIQHNAPYWHQVSVGINFDAEDRFIVLETRNIKPMVYGARYMDIRNISLVPGSCWPNDTTRCSALGPGCEMQDSSTSMNRWSSIDPSMTGAPYRYITHLQPMISRPATMYSPIFELDTEHCLEVKMKWSVTNAATHHMHGEDDPPNIKVVNEARTPYEPLLAPDYWITGIPENKTHVIHTSIPAGLHFAVFSISGRSAHIEILDVELHNFTCTSNGTEYNWEINSNQNITKEMLTTPAEPLVALPSNRREITTDEWIQRANQAAQNTLDYLLRYKGGLSIKEVRNSTGTSITDMLVSCEWGSTPCELEFEELYTDMGKCMVFNSQNRKQRVITKPGIQNGLRLVLSVESYQSIPDISAYSGLKFVLTDQTDVALVEELGFAVAPGQQTLVSLHHQRQTFLDPPHGTCGSLDLDHHKGSTYTYNKCIQDCTIKRQLMTCNCTECFMEVETPLCDFEDYVTCIQPNKLNGYSNIDDDHLQCNCVGSCENSLFEPSLSYNHLETLSSREMDVLTKRTTLKTYVAARELGVRVQGSQMSILLADAIRIVEDTRNLDALMSLGILNPSVSVFNLINKGTEKFTEMLEEDLEISFKGIDDYSRQFNQSMKPGLDKISQGYNAIIFSARQLVLKMGRLITGYAQFVPRIVVDEVVDYINVLREEIDASLQFAFRTEEYLEFLCLSSKPELKLPETLISDRDLRTKCSHAIEYLDEISICMKEKLTEIEAHAKWCNGTSPICHYDSCYCPFTNSPDSSKKDAPCYDESNLEGFLSNFGETDNHYEQFERLLYKFETYTSLIGRCHSELDNYFSDIHRELVPTEWPIIDLSGDLEYLKNFKMLSGVADLLDSALKKYSISEFSTVDLLNKFKEVRDQIGESLENLDIAISQRLAGPSYDNMHQMRSLIMKKYAWAISTAVRFQSYYMDGNEFLENNMRQASIWKQPYPNLQNPDILEFELASSASNLAIQPGIVFNNGEFAKENIQQSLDNYFNSLSSSVSVVTTTMRLSRDNLKAKVLAVIDTLEQYVKGSEGFEQDFLSENILEVAIFYEDKSYMAVTQSEAYPISSFFSDVGGFMGLLLGASIVSVIEALDYFIFRVLFTKSDEEDPKKDSQVPEVSIVARNSIDNNVLMMSNLKT